MLTKWLLWPHVVYLLQINPYLFCEVLLKAQINYSNDPSGCHRREQKKNTFKRENWNATSKALLKLSGFVLRKARERERAVSSVRFLCCQSKRVNMSLCKSLFCISSQSQFVFMLNKVSLETLIKLWISKALGNRTDRRWIPRCVVLSLILVSRR